MSFLSGRSCLQLSALLTVYRTFSYLFSIYLFIYLFQALTLDPSNKPVQEQLRILKQKERQHDQKMSRALGNMFGRKA